MIFTTYDEFIRNGNINGAIEYLQHALKNGVPTGKAEIYERLGYCGYLTCNMGLAADSYLKAAQNDTNLRRQLGHFSNFLFCIHYLPGISPTDLRDNIKYYNVFFQGTENYSHSNEKAWKNRKLRIGYISGDWCNHAMADFLSPFIGTYNEDSFQVFAYMLNDKDKTTEALMEIGNRVVWRDIHNISPLEGADVIYQDKIDILVDLCGHSNGGESLMIMGHKPAPVQASGLGWINTTGLGAIDYFITDRVCCEVPKERALFSEVPLVIDGPQLCYAPVNMARFDFIAAPKRRYSKRDGEIVYGVFSNFNKITDEMLRAWDEILSNVPHGRLVLKDTTVEAARQEAIVNRIKKLSNWHHIIVEGASKDYLACYGDVDIVLDTYPYTGGATVCEALYLGRPVIAIKGDNHGRRLSSSILEYSGFADFIAVDKAEYIKKAVAMATDKEYLKHLHQEIPNKFMQSPIMDQQGYMRKIEQKYQEIKKLPVGN